MYSDDQLKQLLSEFRQLPAETEWLEFKQAKSSFDTDEIGRYFSALSNEANLKNKSCGWLIFGIEDRPPRRIVGSHFRPHKAALDKLKHEIAEHSSGISFQEIFELSLPEGRVLMFQVPAAPASLPTSWKGHFYGRNGESLPLYHCKRLNQSDANRSVLIGALKSAQCTFSDLDEAAVDKAIERFMKKYDGTRISKGLNVHNKEKLLEKIKLLNDKQITRAAILLLGKPEAFVSSQSPSSPNLMALEDGRRCL